MLSSNLPVDLASKNGGLGEFYRVFKSRSPSQRGPYSGRGAEAEIV